MEAGRTERKQVHIMQELLELMVKGYRPAVLVMYKAEEGKVRIASVVDKMVPQEEVVETLQIVVRELQVDELLESVEREVGGE